MQREPIQFGTTAASRARRSTAGFMQPIRTTLKTSSDTNAATVRDEAFADFTRIDAANEPVAPKTPSMTQALIADIATQLEALDLQRRQLARLLESVDASTTV
jgi:hypothetical protein